MSLPHGNVDHKIIPIKLYQGDIMQCLKDEEFMTVDKLIHDRLDILAKQPTSSAFQARKHLLNVRDKLVQLKCTRLSRYED